MQKPSTRNISLASRTPRIFLAVVLVFVAFTQIGCSARPFAGPPGTINSQRNRAVIHDPFPDNEAGPELLGSRPFGFQQPLNETVRTQTTARANRGF